MKKKMTLVGMSESLGFPFCYRNRSRRCLQDHLLENLQHEFTKQNYEINYLNSFSMFFNKSWHIEGILRHNLTKKEIKQMISSGNNAARNSLLTKLGMPKHLGYLDRVQEEDQEHYIRDILDKRQEVLFLYDSGINDFMYYLNHNFFTATTEYQKSRRVVERLQETDLLDQVLQHTRENLKLIYRINPHAHVYLLNFSVSFYTKKILYQLYRNFPTFQQLEVQIKHYNRKLKDLEKDFPVRIVDLSPLGHKKENVDILTEQIRESFDEKIHYREKNSIFLDDFGMDGMIADTRQRLIDLKKKTIFKNKDEVDANARQIEKNQQELAIFVQIKKEATKKEITS